MSVRLPLTGVLDKTVSGDFGAGSVAGGVPLQFAIPNDTDNVVVKLTASTVGGGVSAVFQTSDDGGTTWFDCARTSIVSNSALPEFLSVPTINFGIAPNAVTGSVFGAIGNAAASTLGSKQVSGLPLLSAVNRVFLVYTGNLTKNDSRVQVKVNQQASR